MAGESESPSQRSQQPQQEPKVARCLFLLNNMLSLLIQISPKDTLHLQPSLKTMELLVRAVSVVQKSNYRGGKTLCAQAITQDFGLGVTSSS